ncbi:MAG: response regulator transcription factor [Candidatus Acidiferrum sp.]|jgi:DNA-binding NarL/FixJ family response regulator
MLAASPPCQNRQLKPNRAVCKTPGNVFFWTQPATAQVGRGVVEVSHSDTRCIARILIVEDFSDFRRFICTTLGARFDWRVIAEVADGLEAVQKAAELKPDLILLDIGLPKLNGIDVARQVRQLSPESKIVFLSQESSADVVKEALSTGACGYVVKAKAATRLLAAVEAAISGTRPVDA